LTSHAKHGLGWEFLDRARIRRVPPEHLEQDKYMVFRHEANLPIVGFRAGDVFIVLWAEARYGDVYNH
jgi:hypothetical protein